MLATHTSIPESGNLIKNTPSGLFIEILRAKKWEGGATRSLRKLETVLKDKMAALSLKIPLRPLDVPVKAQSVGSTLLLTSPVHRADCSGAVDNERTSYTFLESNAKSIR